MCHSQLFSSSALTFCCPLCVISNASFFLCPSTCPWLQQRQRRALQVGFHEKKHPAHDYLYHHLFQSGAVSNLTVANSFLNVHRQQRLQLTFKNSLRSNTDSFVVADLDTLVDHPCDLSARDKTFFFLCSFFLNEDFAFESLR